MSTKTELAVLVTTSNRGVFFGYTDDPNAENIELKRGRMCVYWSQEMQGVLGLAQDGPNSNCKISPAAPVLRLRGVTAVANVTPEAVKRWEDQPWAS